MLSRPVSKCPVPRPVLTTPGEGVGSQSPHMTAGLAQATLALGHYVWSTEVRG